MQNRYKKSSFKMNNVKINMRIKKIKLLMYNNYLLLFLK